jgi:hypothetical protein
LLHKLSGKDKDGLALERRNIQPGTWMSSSFASQNLMGLPFFLSVQLKNHRRLFIDLGMAWSRHPSLTEPVTRVGSAISKRFYHVNQSE